MTGELETHMYFLIFNLFNLYIYKSNNIYNLPFLQYNQLFEEHLIF